MLLVQLLAATKWLGVKTQYKNRCIFQVYYNHPLKEGVQGELQRLLAASQKRKRIQRFFLLFLLSRILLLAPF
jgi:hypothetical protein